MKPMLVPSGEGKTVNVIGADGEGAVLRFAAGFLVLKLRAISSRGAADVHPSAAPA